MKKRLLVFGLLIAMLMTAAMPAPVMAATGEKSGGRDSLKTEVTTSGKRDQRDSFKADGQAYVAGVGNIVSQKKLGKNITAIKKAGEVIAGEVAACSEWPEFAGAQFQITEDNLTTLNFQTNKFISIATGTVAVLKDGIPVMTGKYGAIMRGDFSGDDLAQVVFNEVIDNGLIELKGIPGTAFAGLDVKGTVHADLEIDFSAGTLVGPFTIRGNR